ncbi:MAG: methytransferase partner Trm112 [Chloroflexi bacterium]|nr:methytransferase partner Trm112 [Chloroflexota bacterium]
MKRDLLDILACPTCKAEFDLSVEEENDQEIVRGTLTCKQCGEVYPITDTIPDLRPPHLREASASDEFDDLDELEEEGRPRWPILLAVAALVAAVVLAVVIQLRQRRRRRTLTLPVVGEVAVPPLSEVHLPSLPSRLSELRAQLPDVAQLRAQLPEMPELKLPEVKAPALAGGRRGWFRR